MNHYIDNVKNAVHRNLRHYIQHDTKEVFLTRVIAYCEKLLNDPAEPKMRTRIRSGKKYKTKEAINARGTEIQLLIDWPS